MHLGDFLLLVKTFKNLLQNKKSYDTETVIALDVCGASRTQALQYFYK